MTENLSVTRASWVLVASVSMGALAQAVVSRPHTNPLIFLAVVDTVQALAILTAARWQRWPAPQRWYQPVLLAGLFGASALCIWQGLQWAPVGPAVALASLTPILYLGEQMLRGQRRLGWRELQICLLVLAALGLTAANLHSGDGAYPAPGLLLAFGSCLLAALAYRLVQHWGRQYDTRSLPGWRSLGVSAFAWTAVLLFTPSWQGAALPLWVATALFLMAPAAFLTWRALPAVPATRYGLISLIALPLTACLAALLFGRSLTLQDALITALILAALGLEQRAERRLD